MSSITELPGMCPDIFTNSASSGAAPRNGRGSRSVVAHRLKSCANASTEPKTITKFRRFRCFFTAEMMICWSARQDWQYLTMLFMFLCQRQSQSDSLSILSHLLISRLPSFQTCLTGDESLQRQLQENHSQIILRNSPSLEEFVICQWPLPWLPSNWKA